MKWIFIIAGVILVVLLLTYQTSWYRGKLKKEFKQFYEMDLNGKIISSGISAGVVYFELDNEKEKFSFIPVVGPLNDNKNFFEIVSTGDSLIKHANTDTLELIKPRKIYKFTFQKF